MTQRLNALADRATGQSFGLTNYGNLEAAVNYLIQAGGNIASGSVISISAIFHGLTGSTTVTTITDSIGASKGQIVRLWIVNGPVKFSASLGNIVTLSGNDFTASQNEMVDFVYDGANWRLKQVVAVSGVSYILTGTGTYTAPPAARTLQISGWGAGGGGAGCAAAGASQVAAGSGGSAGSYAEKTITSNIGVHSVAVGSGSGTGGASGANAGSNGGDTTFADSSSANVLTAKSGLGGSSILGGGTAVGTTGTTNGQGGNVGDLTVIAAGSSRGVRLSGTIGYTTEGGQAPRGGGCTTRLIGDGSSGLLPGGGGGGGIDSANANRAGGNGANGLLVVVATA